MREEFWLPVVGYEGLYAVSDLGRVKSLDRVVLVRNKNGASMRRLLSQIIKIGIQPDTGRPVVRLSKDGQQRTIKVHILVALSFLGPRPMGKEVAHGDGNALRNVPHNLRYATRLENVSDMVAHGTMPRGERNGLSKLTTDSVRRIRELRATGLSQQKIADIMGVTQMVISKIDRRINWGHVDA